MDQLRPRLSFWPTIMPSFARDSPPLRAQGRQVLGQCADGQSALEMVQTLQPDFAILDLHMPGLDGTEVVRQLRPELRRQAHHPLHQREENTVRRALRAGADAYLLKDGPARHLRDAVIFVGEGGIYISPLLRGAGLFTEPQERPAGNPLASLSPRELEVFHQLVNGLRAKDIAKLLDISPRPWTLTAPVYFANSTSTIW